VLLRAARREREVGAYAEVVAGGTCARCGLTLTGGQVDAARGASNIESEDRGSQRHTDDEGCAAHGVAGSAEARCSRRRNGAAAARVVHLAEDPSWLGPA
jgi:hypothetical protein